MTDELTIQGVNPQMQQVQKKNNTVPYTLGGAAVGAAAGWGATALYKGSGSAKSYEDLVKDANEKDKLELTSKKDAVTKAEQELAEASKPQIDKNSIEQQNYDTALKAKEDAYNKLFEQKKTALEKNNSSTGKAKLLTFDQLGEYPSTNVKTGKPFTKSDRSDIKKVYDDLIRDYNNAEARLNTSVSTGIGAERSNKYLQIKNYLDSQYHRYSSTSVEDINDIFGKRTELKGLPGFKHEVPTPQYQAALNIANIEYPEFTSANIKPEQYLEFASEVDSKTPIAKGYTRKPINLIDPATGRPSPKTTYVEYKIEDLNKFVEEQEKLVSEKRIAYADELFTNAHESVLLQKKKHTFLNDFGATVEKGLATQSGYYDATTNVLNMNDIVNESKRTRLTVGTGKKAKTGFAADIKVLNDTIKAAEKAGTTPTMPALLNGDYVGITDPKKALEMAGARNKIAESYNKEMKSLSEQIDNCIKNNTVIQTLDDKIADIKANDKGLAKAKAKLTEQFPNVFKEKGANLTAEQIETQAKEYADKNLSKSLTDAVERTKGDLDKVIAEKGKVNETAKKTAQEAVEKAKGELDKLVAELNGRVKGMSGTAKALVIGGVAAAGALIGLSMSNKSKNV